MTNKEIYDKAVAGGLEFTYFAGEEFCPDAYEDSDCETFWNMEAEAAWGDPLRILESFAADLKSDSIAPDEEKRVPEFITKSNASNARKAVAYECYAEFRYSSNGLGTLKESDEIVAKFNDDRGFEEFLK